MDGSNNTGPATPEGAVSRRQFMKAAGLLCAAAAATPVVLKAREVLADPDPPSADAEVLYILSTCRICQSRCGIKAKLRAGRVVKIDGNPYHPNNRGDDERLAFTRTPTESRNEFGRLCPRGQAGVQTLYDPYRIQHPLRRSGARGSGRWEVITWDQAFTEIAARINALIPFAERVTRDIDPANADLGKIANGLVYCPGRGVDKALAERIFKSGYGTANYDIDDASIIEGSAQVGTQLATYEHVSGTPGLSELKTDMDRAAYMLVFGANPVESSPPMLALARKTAEMRDPRRSGGMGRIVVVDPRFSNSAAKADLWVPIKPGGDAALALGIARAMIAGARHNVAFLRNANKAAATAANEPCYTDATWLVIVEAGHPNEGKLLTPAEAGLTGVVNPAHPVCIRSSDGAPVEVQINGPSGGPATAVVGTLEPVSAGADYVTVNGIRCRSSFAIYRAAVFEYTLDQYATIAGVSAAVISQLATELTSSGRRASAWAYRGALQHTNGAYTQLAVMALNWMIGNVDYAGGLSRGGGGWAEGNATGGVNTAAVAGAVTPAGPRIDRAGAEYTADKSYFRGYPAPRQWFPFATTGNYQELVPSIAQSYPYAIKALITAWTDWPYAVPGGKAVWERTVSNETALPLLVSISPVFGEVATWADYVLPDTTYLESWGFPGQSAAISTKQTPIQQPVAGAFDGAGVGATGRWAFDPSARNAYTPLLPDTKMHGDILIGLARALSPSFPGVGVDALGAGVNLERAWDFYRHQFSQRRAQRGHRPHRRDRRLGRPRRARRRLRRPQQRLRPDQRRAPQQPARLGAALLRPEARGGDQPGHGAEVPRRRALRREAPPRRDARARLGLPAPARDVHPRAPRRVANAHELVAHGHPAQELRRALGARRARRGGRDRRPRAHHLGVEPRRRHRRREGHQGAAPRRRGRLQRLRSLGGRREGPHRSGTRHRLRPLARRWRHGQPRDAARRLLGRRHAPGPRRRERFVQ